MTTIKQRFFCNHDWFTVDSMTATNVIIEFIKTHSAADFPYSVNDISYTSPYHSRRVLHDKVCLKCKLVKPELSSFRKKLENMEKHEFDKAKTDARRMLEATAKQAQAWNKKKIEAKIILTEYLNNI